VTPGTVAALSSLLVLAAVVLGLLTCLVTRSFAPGVPLFLDLLLAAGLLRLTVEQSWRALATTATIVVIRKLAAAGIGLTAGRR
jgi:hypothetical protein